MYNGNPVNKILGDVSKNKNMIHYCKCPHCGYITGVRNMYPAFHCQKCKKWNDNPYWDEYSSHAWKKAFDESGD